jgi:environmental stress-induced protein Ves
MIIHLDDCLPQPWKNGLGRTRELAVQTSATGTGFLWRVSIAEVDSAAPFSRFPGIDRSIALLEGAGFHMTMDGTDVHPLTAACEPFAFAGEAQVDVALVAGATRDFNLMVKRDEARGELQVWRGPLTRSVPRAAVLVYCARGHGDTPEAWLRAGDAWRPDAPGAGLRLAADAIALAALVTPRHA